MKKMILLSLVGLLILLLSGCGLMPFATPGVEQPSEAPEGLEIELDPSVDLELAQSKEDYTKYVPDDTEIGTWDPVTRIYTLTTDVYARIYIVEDSLTLDGAGHRILGGHMGYGIYLDQRSNVTVKNCDVCCCYYGIVLEDSSYNTLTENTVNGIWYWGIYLLGSDSNTLTENTGNGNDVGIFLLKSSSNTINYNTAKDNSEYGIILANNSNYNKVYNNNFINNPIQAWVFESSGNEFYLAKPDGGNYWSDWTSPDEDYDGFVDDPYGFTGGQDNLPWVCQDGWKPTKATGYLITTVEDFKLPEGVEQSLIALLKAAINALENQHEQAAIGQLTGFIQYVKGLQNGNKLTQEQAQTLIAAAQRIIDSIQ